MAITKVWLDESSEMKVKEGVDYSAYESEIKDAADSCPAGVIKYE